MSSLINKELLPKIRIICNKLGNEKTREMDKMKRLFEGLKNQGIGKLTENYYICNTNVTLQSRNEIEETFCQLQVDSMRKGFGMNMFAFNI